MIKENKGKTMTFRLTEKEFAYLEKTAFTMGSTPSKLVRQLIQMSINAAIAQEDAIKKAKEEPKEIIEN